MKKLVKRIGFFLITLSVFASCKKETAVSPLAPRTGNNRPVANAGIDVAVSILSCYDKTISSKVDGSGSADPDNNIATYQWVPLYGPPGSIIKSPNSVITPIEKLSPGIHAFELKVTDLGGFSSKDTVLVTVLGNSGIPTAYDLDMTINTSYGFFNNHNDPYYDPPNFYYDYTWFRKKTIFLPLGEFQIGVFETADSAELSNALYGSLLQIRTTNPSSYLYLDGKLGGFSFKELIREGGGSFTGTLTVTWGSAEYCDPNAFTNLPPLIVTGTLNTLNHTVSLRVRGRAFF